MSWTSDSCSPDSTTWQACTSFNSAAAHFGAEGFEVCDPILVLLLLDGGDFEAVSEFLEVELQLSAASSANLATTSCLQVHACIGDDGFLPCCLTALRPVLRVHGPPRTLFAMLLGNECTLVVEVVTRPSVGDCSTEPCCSPSLTYTRCKPLASAAWAC